MIKIKILNTGKVDTEETIKLHFTETPKFVQLATLTIVEQELLIVTLVESPSRYFEYNQGKRFLKPNKLLV